MCLTMIAGVLLQTLLNHTPFKDSVDEHVEGRIGSMVTDYLVGFGVASISITVVMESWAPSSCCACWVPLPPDPGVLCGPEAVP